MIHEDITSLIAQANKTRKTTGSFPPSIDSFTFSHPFVKSHIYSYAASADAFSVTYFMNDPGVTYSYSPGDGFFYYPD